MSNLKRSRSKDSKDDVNKRKHVSLTVLQKVDIIKKLDAGTTPRHIADTFGIGTRTVYDIRKNKDKLLKFYSKSDSNAGIQNRKSMHQAKSADLDAVVYEWFRTRRNDGIPISGPVLRAKAKELHAELKIEQPCDFSHGWLTKFKRRHGIRYIKTYGEKLSADTDAAEEFIDEFSSLVTTENLSPEQIFNADETGLFWRCLPNRTYVTPEESAPSGVKEAKERVTVLVCSNAAGTYRCKLLVVAKSKQPRALKGIKTLPVLYRNNKRAWITKEMMTDWFMNHFVKEARNHCTNIGLPANCKILLLVDNCTAHPDPSVLSSDNVVSYFLPPNTTSLIQPMDQGIINSLKCHYKSELLKKIINSSSKFSEYKKMFTIKDCIYLLAESWNSVSQSTLVNGWHNLWPSSLFIETDNDNTEFSGFRDNPVKAKAEELLLYAKQIAGSEQLAFEEKDIVDFINDNDDVPDNLQMTDSDIIDGVLNSKDGDSESDDSEDVVQNCDKISFDEGLALGEKYLKFLEQQNSITDQEIMTVYNMQKKLKLQHPKILKQVTIEHMFKRVQNNL